MALAVGMVALGCLFGAIIVFALERKGDVKVSLSVLRRWFEFSLTAKDRRGN